MFQGRKPGYTECAVSGISFNGGVNHLNFLNVLLYHTAQSDTSIRFSVESTQKRLKTMYSFVINICPSEIVCIFVHSKTISVMSVVRSERPEHQQDGNDKSKFLVPTSTHFMRMVTLPFSLTLRCFPFIVYCYTYPYSVVKL